jgi:hypothetical protein
LDQLSMHLYLLFWGKYIMHQSCQLNHDTKCLSHILFMYILLFHSIHNLLVCYKQCKLVGNQQFHLLHSDMFLHRMEEDNLLHHLLHQYILYNMEYHLRLLNCFGIRNSIILI